MDVLKKAAKTTHKIGEDVLIYVTEMREKLGSVTELVQENLAETHKRQELWYDWKARGSWTTGFGIIILNQQERESKRRLET